MLKSVAAQAPRVVSGLAILAVAVAAGVISYQHVEDLTLRLHGTLLAARLMPVGVDGLIAVGSMVLLQGGMLGWVCIGPGVAISLFANIESGLRYGALAAIWAGIPAVSFALASFVLERWLAGQVHKPEPDAAQTVTGTQTMADAESEAAPEVPTDAPASEPSPDSLASETVTPQDEPASETVARVPRVGMSLEEAAREFEAEVAVGEQPSLRQIQTRCHAGRPRAKEIRTHLIALIDGRTIASVGASEAASTERVREPVSL